jgi:hypothetical protein
MINPGGSMAERYISSTILKICYYFYASGRIWEDNIKASLRQVRKSGYAWNTFRILSNGGLRY